MKNEIENLKDELFFLSLEKEKKQQRYINNIEEQHNSISGVVYNMSYSIKKEQLKKLRERQQQIYTITNIAKFKGMKALFLTLTVPSSFHPFIINPKSGKIIKRNPRFEFKSINEAINPSYLKLKNVYRDFYKQLKKLDKDIFYIKVYEPHKTLIPHMHILLFINPIHQERVKKIFYQVVKRHKLIKVDFDETLFLDDIRKPHAYIMKYLFKTTLADGDYMARWLDGWRRKYKIRVLETSQLPMSLEVYQSIYYSLSNEQKEEIDNEIKKTNSNYFEYFINNTDIDIKIVDKDDKLVSYRKILKGKKYKIL